MRERPGEVTGPASDSGISPVTVEIAQLTMAPGIIGWHGCRLNKPGALLIHKGPFRPGVVHSTFVRAMLARWLWCASCGPANHM